MVILQIAALLALTHAGNADVDKEKVRGLLRLPELSLEVHVQYIHNQGYEFQSGAPTPAETPEQMRKGLRSAPGDAQIYYDIGNLYNHRNQAAEARTAWEQCIALD